MLRQSHAGCRLSRTFPIRTACFTEIYGNGQRCPVGAHTREALAMSDKLPQSRHTVRKADRAPPRPSCRIASPAPGIMERPVCRIPPGGRPGTEPCLDAVGHLLHDRKGAVPAGFASVAAALLSASPLECASFPGPPGTRAWCARYRIVSGQFQHCIRRRRSSTMPP